MRFEINTPRVWRSVVLMLPLLSAPLFAHHAISAFDRDASVSVSGTVTKWQFINPHAGIWIDVINENGDVESWSGEFQGTLDLYRYYIWNKDTFAPGDEITMTGFPARNGDATMAVRLVGFADGEVVDVRSAPD